MGFDHVTRHVREYWNSLRGVKRRERGASLGERLDCPVFVINLERSVHRRQYAIDHLAGHGVQARIVPAVDGNTLDLDELSQQGVYDDSLARQKFSRSLSRNEIACTLSHVNVWRKMIADDVPMAMILEDDVMLAPDIADAITAALDQAPANWDIIQLYHDCREQIPIGEHLVRFPCTSRMPVGSAGYLIRRSGAEKMVAHALPVCYPADSLLGRSHRWGVWMYGFAGSVLEQNAVFPTQIYVHVGPAVRIKRLLKWCLVATAGQIAKTLRKSP